MATKSKIVTMRKRIHFHACFGIGMVSR
jgi:hypothetical protein